METQRRHPRTKEANKHLPAHRKWVFSVAQMHKVRPGEVRETIAVDLRKESSPYRCISLAAPLCVTMCSHRCD